MRRSNGTGTVVKLSGNRRKPYAVRVPGRDKHGCVIQKALSYHATAKEAQAALDDYNAKKAQGTAVEVTSLSITLGKVYEMWSARKYAKAGSASIGAYKASWGRLEALSTLKMRDVTIDHLQAVIDADEAAGMSKSTIQNDKTLMRALFRFSMERDIIVKDYSDFVQIPNVGAKYEKGAFTDIQLKQLEKMAVAGEPWADTVLMLCYTGFRITEFLSLSKFSYNAKENYLQGGIKTEAGKNRIVPVHPKIKPYLLSWLKREGDTIICDSNGKPLKVNWYRASAFPAIVEKLGVAQATPHWCRHTFSTRLHAAGVPDLEHKRLMGHANKDVTEHYTHTDIGQLTAAIELLA